MTTSETQPFAALDGEQFIVLTTYRKNGAAVPTTVWFAERDGKLYIITGSEAGKSKRIRSNPQVTVAPSDMRGGVTGTTIAARAHAATPAEHATAAAALDAKYGAQLARIRGDRDAASAFYLVVTPAEQAE